VRGADRRAAHARAETDIGGWVGESGFDAALLSQTFSWATWGNGLVAILSGVAANMAADSMGLVAPFMLAIVTFAVGGAVIAFSWSENYGQRSVSTHTHPPTHTHIHMRVSLCGVWVRGAEHQLVCIAQDGPGRLHARYAQRHPTKGRGNACTSLSGPSRERVCPDRAVLSLGLIQSFFEGAMYSFVFMWTPALQRGLGTHARTHTHTYTDALTYKCIRTACRVDVGADGGGVGGGWEQRRARSCRFRLVGSFRALWLR
jgi:hypothetical protein